MQDFSNFLNNLRTNATKWEADLNRSANQALNQIGQSVNQAVQTGTAPYRYLGNAVNNIATATGNNIANGINALANGVANKLPVAGGAATTTSAPRTDQTVQAQPSSNAYERDSNIDTFVSFLRTAMNPLRGITGDTPLDAIVNSVSSTLYNSFGKKANGNNGQTQEAAPSTDGSGATEPQTAAPEEDVTTYTYQAGDTFGDVIRKLGLESGNGLWGENGDVRYYTDQLYGQGLLDRNGNIPIGTTIKLQRRK